MRTLNIHSDYIKFEVKKKAIKDAEIVDKKEGMAENALVAFMAVEIVDEVSKVARRKVFEYLTDFKQRFLENESGHRFPAYFSLADRCKKAHANCDFCGMELVVSVYGGVEGDAYDNVCPNKK